MWARLPSPGGDCVCRGCHSGKGAGKARTSTGLYTEKMDSVTYAHASSGEGPCRRIGAHPGERLAVGERADPFLAGDEL